MSQAEELLNSLLESEGDHTAGMGDKEQHIVIGRDRSVNVPRSLRKIAVQFDHNVETVTFDCPRYWDKLDMSTMKVYVNYMRADGYMDKYLCKNVVVDATDENIMHFDWTLTGNATQVEGRLVFLVCIKKTDANGNEENHWNSELGEGLYVSEGMECDETILAKYPDIITHLLTRMEEVEGAKIVVTGEQILALQNKINTEKANVQAEIDVERKRIDKIAKLEEGSTTGDIELIDGRRDYTGKEWDNIGAHVRGVTSRLSSENAELFKIDINVSLKETDFELGVFYDGENASWDDYTKIRSINKMKYPYCVTIAPIKKDFMVALYDENGVFISQTGWLKGLYHIPANTYFRLCIMNESGETLPSINDGLNGFYCYKKELASMYDENYILKNILNYKDIDLNELFESGLIDSDGYNSSYLENRTIRTKRIIKMPCDMRIKCKNGTTVIFYEYANDSFISDTEWLSEFIIKANTPFRLSIRKTDDSDVNGILKDVIFENLEFKNTVANEVVGSATPVKIYQCREGSVSTTKYPPNTKYGIREVARNQFDRIRFTVRVTTDKKYVLIHDDYINNVARNKDGSQISEIVGSDGKSLAELNNYDWGIAYGDQYKGLTVPTLEEALHFASMYNLAIMLELNFAPSYDDVDNIYNLLCKYGVLDNFIIAVYELSYMTLFTEKDDRIGLLWGGSVEELRNSVRELKVLKNAKNRIGVWQTPLFSNPTDDFCILAHRNGLEVFKTILSIDDLPSCFENGVSYIECANIERIKSTVRDYVDSLI